MAPHASLTARPEEVGLSAARVDALVARLRAMVERDEIPSGQLALARHGRVAARAAFGAVSSAGRSLPATDDTLYVAFSTTKAVVASAVWLLVQDGKLRAADRVADWIPGFEAGGKAAVRVEHLLTHTAGFPDAPFAILDWNDPALRRERFASWRLEWAPGERFAYHPTSSLWVVAEVIERAAGCDFREFIRRRIAEPLALPDLHLGLPPEADARVAEVVEVGAPPEPEALGESGLALPTRYVGADASMLQMNHPEHRAVGVPGGGLVTNAATLALFYQGLLADLRGAGGPGVWRPEILRDALRVRTDRMVDPMTGRLAKRALGVVIAGGEHRVYRSFAPGNSENAFGHPGAGGQIAWADPESGLSFAFLTNGCDRNPLAMGARGIGLAQAATRCLAADAGRARQQRRSR
jgi:CubicO group peptidase (beta-lactamase class C family)